MTKFIISDQWNYRPIFQYMDDFDEIELQGNFLQKSIYINYLKMIGSFPQQHRPDSLSYLKKVREHLEKKYPHLRLGPTDIFRILLEKARSHLFSECDSQLIPYWLQFITPEKYQIILAEAKKPKSYDDGYHGGPVKTYTVTNQRLIDTLQGAQREVGKQVTPELQAIKCVTEIQSTFDLENFFRTKIIDFDDFILSANLIRKNIYFNCFSSGVDENAEKMRRLIEKKYPELRLTSDDIYGFLVHTIKNRGIYAFQFHDYKYWSQFLSLTQIQRLHLIATTGNEEVDHYDGPPGGAHPVKIVVSEQLVSKFEAILKDRKKGKIDGIVFDLEEKGDVEIPPVLPLPPAVPQPSAVAAQHEEKGKVNRDDGPKPPGGPRPEAAPQSAPIKAREQKLSVEVPEDYVCGISGMIMRVPFTASDTYTYEQEYLIDLIKRGQASPYTKKPFAPNEVGVLNRPLRGIIDKFLKAHPEALDDVHMPNSLVQDCFNAIKTDDVKTFQSLCEQDERLLTIIPSEVKNTIGHYCQSDINETAMQYAVRLGSARIIGYIKEWRKRNPVKRLETSYAQEIRDNQNLLLAITENDETEFTKLLDKANPNSVNKEGDTALHLAARYGRVAMMRDLLKRNAAIVPAYNGDTPLHIAAHYNQIEILQLLSNEFNEKVDWQAKGVRGRTALHAAADRRSSEAMAFLLTKIDANARDREGRTPLFDLCQEGFPYLADEAKQLPLVYMLLERQADIHAKDEQKNTLLHITKNAKILEIFLDRGAASMVNTKNEDGVMPIDPGYLQFYEGLHREPNYLIWLKLLLEAGAHPDGSTQNVTPLIHALTSAGYHPNQECALLFIEFAKRNRLPLGYTTKDGRIRPILDLVEEGSLSNPDVIGALLRAGCNEISTKQVPASLTASAKMLGLNIKHVKQSDFEQSYRQKHEEFIQRGILRAIHRSEVQAQAVAVPDSAAAGGAALEQKSAHSHANLSTHHAALMPRPASTASRLANSVDNEQKNTADQRCVIS